MSTADRANDAPAGRTGARSSTPQNAAFTAVDERIQQLREKAVSANTWRAYYNDWTRWAHWATAHHAHVLPADPRDLARYLVQAADPDLQATSDDERGHQAQGDEAPRPVSMATVNRWTSSIRWIHRQAGHRDPFTDTALQDTLAGLRRGVPQRRHSAPPLWTSDIERILAAIDASPTGGRALAEVRDRALILLAFTTGLRSSELIALRIENLENDPSGLIVHVGRSKTDQLGEGTDIGVPWAERAHLDPILALEAWLRRLRAALVTHPDPAGTEADYPGATQSKASAMAQRRALLADLSGPVFRSITRHGRLGAQGRPDAPPDTPLSHNAIRLIIAKRCRAAGLTPSTGNRYFSAHSTRSGMATQAAANGANERDIMAQGRWKSTTVARGYIRRGNLFSNNAAGRLGL